MRKCLLFFAYCLVPALSAQASIDNVPSYSSNPFYSADSPYNQRPAVPVYVKGPSLTAAECLVAVNSAIWTQCSFLNNCISATLSDIRPGVVMELANKTDNNYSSCVGYIDGAFQEFKAGANGSVSSASFPAATKPSVYDESGAPTNPFAYGNQVPEYEYEQKMRQYQLDAAQQQNNPLPVLTPDQMPGTFQDLSLTEQMPIMREGWKDPAVNKYPSYPQLNVESDEEMYQRMRTAAETKAAAETAKERAAAEIERMKAEAALMNAEARKKELEIEKLKSVLEKL